MERRRSSEDDDDEEERRPSSREDEEEEHLAPADSAALPAIDPVPSAEETEPFETDESAATPPPPPHTIVIVSITRLHRAHISFDPILLHYHLLRHSIAEAAMVQLRVASPSTYHPLHVPSPPLLLPSADHRSDIPETDMLSRKRLCLIAPTSRFEVGESSTAAAARQTGHTLARRVDYGFLNTLDGSIRVSKGQIYIKKTQRNRFNFLLESHMCLITYATKLLATILHFLHHTMPSSYKTTPSPC
ncbi:hypothetical protein Tco_1233944 [Tanacetum coccineum]